MTTTVPDFELPATGNQRFKLSAFAGHPFVLYFYPRDDTPGCTDEGLQFMALNDEFRKAGYTIFGISRDTVASHEKFKKKMGFPFELLADPDETVCNLFGVMKEKNMYGKKVRGIERSTFIFGRDGKVVKEWRGVKVPNHAQEVLDAVKALG
ncbi:MAG: peroxiredoxin [Burkholderiales bacterium]|nr:peroxiredoxin [Burkholderiales bacterium]